MIEFKKSDIISMRIKYQSIILFNSSPFLSNSIIKPNKIVSYIILIYLIKLFK